MFAAARPCENFRAVIEEIFRLVDWGHLATYFHRLIHHSKTRETQGQIAEPEINGQSRGFVQLLQQIRLERSLWGRDHVHHSLSHLPVTLSFLRGFGILLIKEIQVEMLLDEDISGEEIWHPASPQGPCRQPGVVLPNAGGDDPGQPLSTRPSILPWCARVAKCHLVSFDT
jgi:hypothetical protein